MLLVFFFSSHLFSDLSNIQGSSFGLRLTNPETLSPFFVSMNLIFWGKAEVALSLHLAALGLM